MSCLLKVIYATLASCAEHGTEGAQCTMVHPQALWSVSNMKQSAPLFPVLWGVGTKGKDL